MLRPAFLVAHYGRRFVPCSILLAAVLSACADPTVPGDVLSTRPASIIVIDGKLERVFNVQLRSVEDPNIIDDPNIRPHGNLQLKMYENLDGTFTLEWKGQIFNPAGESFTGFSLTQLGIDRPALFVALGEVDGSPNDEPVFDVFDHSAIQDNLYVDLVAEEPAGMWPEPDLGDFVIVFFSVERPDGSLTGRL